MPTVKVSAEMKRRDADEQRKMIPARIVRISKPRLSKWAILP